MSELSEYKVLETIGEGSFARVSKVQRRANKQILVWKELRYGKMSDKEKQMLCDEVNILRSLNHTNIVRCINYIISHKTRKIYIVQEFCDGGDLQSYLKRKKQQCQLVSESFIWTVLSEVASALQHCHGFGRAHSHPTDEMNGTGGMTADSSSVIVGSGATILHRDLKPSNIFLCRRGRSYSVKLGDFGLAKVLNQSLFAQTHVGTPYYMSPEQICQQHYNHQSDVWSLGCVTYEMATLQPPFQAKSYLELAMQIQRGVCTPVSSVTTHYGRDLQKVIDSMLKVDPNQRATVNDILHLSQVQQTLARIRIHRRYLVLKRKENELAQKEMELLEKERMLLQKEAALHMYDQKCRFIQTRRARNTSPDTSSLTSNPTHFSSESTTSAAQFSTTPLSFVNSMSRTLSASPRSGAFTQRASALP